MIQSNSSFQDVVRLLQSAPVRRAVDEALDTNTAVFCEGLVLVPEMLMIQLMGSPGGDPNFDPATTWTILRERDNGMVMVWTDPR